ncbi:TPA: DUF3037 domain-containing protein [Pseudomonas aeruginosa]|nr:DUF3037 domain-containing protein [Pseudomonas aeruginosa]HBO2639110.1 DUF3037 domain-containing protein [Pseudomonas aeruginosa]
MKLTNYDYSVLRYVHDRTTGEFVNVGVVMYSAEEEFISAKCRSTISRISSVFPDFHREGFKKMMRHIVDRFDELNSKLRCELKFSGDESLRALLKKVLPDDDSSLQWGELGHGLAIGSLPDELEHLYSRLISKYDAPASKERRTELDIWRDFERHLAPFIPSEEFVSKKISVLDDELEFKHAWKNGIWHCIEPVSFDLSDGDYLKDKAHKWLGQMTSIKSTKESFKVYLLISKPQENSLSFAFEKAVSILNKIPVEKEIFLEEDASELANKIIHRFEQHNREVH